MHADIPFDVSLHWRDAFFVPSESDISEDSAIGTVMAYPLSSNEDISGASLCLSHNDVQGAIKFLTPCAKVKDDQVMQILGEVSPEKPQRWLRRAIRNGNIMAMQDLGMCVYGHYFWLAKHASVTGSLESMRELGGEWADEAAMRGDVISFGESFFDVIEATDAGKPEIPLGAVPENTEVPSFESSLAVVKMVEMVKDGENPKKQLQQNPSVMVERGCMISPTKVPPKTPLFPKTGKTRLLIEIFRAASADFSERNLGECGKLMNRLGVGFAKTLMASQLFKDRAERGTASQQTSCGFAAFVAGMEDLAMSLWKVSARRGCLTGMLMMGLGLFHGWGGPMDRNKAGLYLARCMVDPIALAHLGLATKSQEPLNRATHLLGINRADRHLLFEWVGDLFADGTKLPQRTELAEYWWAQAAMSLEKAGKSYANLLQKLACC